MHARGMSGRGKEFCSQLRYVYINTTYVTLSTSRRPGIALSLGEGRRKKLPEQSSCHSIRRPWGLGGFFKTLRKKKGGISEDNRNTMRRRKCLATGVICMVDGWLRSIQYPPEASIRVYTKCNSVWKLRHNASWTRLKRSKEKNASIFKTNFVQSSWSVKPYYSLRLYNSLQAHFSGSDLSFTALCTAGTLLPRYTLTFPPSKSIEGIYNFSTQLLHSIILQTKLQFYPEGSIDWSLPIYI